MRFAAAANRGPCDASPVAVERGETLSTEDPRASVLVPIQRQPGAEDLPLPERATPGSAGFDLHAAVTEETVLAPGARVLIPTGVSIAVPAGYEAQVRPRSGLALRHGIVLPNAPGTIDSDYRGELKVILCNLGEEPFSVKRGDRIAQLVIAPVAHVEWVETTDLDDTQRGAGGFGHSGRRVRGVPVKQTITESRGEES